MRVCPGCRMNCTQGSLKKSQLGMKTKSRPFRGTAFAYFENVFIPEFRCSEALCFRCLYAQNAIRAHDAVRCGVRDAHCLHDDHLSDHDAGDVPDVLRNLRAFQGVRDERDGICLSLHRCREVSH